MTDHTLPGVAMKRLLEFLVVISAVSLGVIGNRAGAAESASRPPNVLFLFADDQRADTIAAWGNPRIRTPNLDRLVRSGLSFRRAYMQGAFGDATCVASRAMLLTGQSLFHVEIGMLRNETWPAAFGRSGYTTFMTGKWHNGSLSLPLCFQEARGVFVGGFTDPLRAELSNLQNGQFTAPQVAKQHACAVFADEAIEFVRRKHDKPFFCYVSFDAPHDPHIVPADFPVKYDPDKLPLPGSYLPDHPFDNGDMEARDELLLPRPRTERAIRQMLADYYRYITYLDQEIGRVLDALDASPEGKNTIVVFAADSGVARGSHGLVGKQNLYELDSVRVPLVIAGPGIPQNKSTDAMCYLYDVLPTLGARCNVAAPPKSDGIDMAATLRDPAHPARENLLFAYRNVQRAIATRDWKLIVYPQARRIQLFHLSEDLEEIHDLSDKPESVEKIKELIALLKKEMAAADDNDLTRGAARPRPIIVPPGTKQNAPVPPAVPTRPRAAPSASPAAAAHSAAAPIDGLDIWPVLTAGRQEVSTDCDMSILRLFPGILCDVSALAVGQSTSAADTADVIFRHGRIYTVNEKQPAAEALAVKNGKLLFVGSDQEAARLQGAATRVVDLGGHVVVPGLTDSHCHLSGVGQREMNLNLEGTTSLDDFLAKVKARVERAKPGEWIAGAGWIESAWKPQAFPTRWDLDKVSPNNPVFLSRADRHGAVANSAAIKLAGIDKNTASPFGGEIMKDKKTGEPNGMFLDNAVSLIARHLPGGEAGDDERAILLGVERSLQLGWTEVHIAGNTFAEVALLTKLYAAGRIKLRVYDAILGPSADSRRLLADGPTIGQFDQRFTCRGIKVVYDGALGSKGAALLEKYADYDSTGLVKWREEDLRPTFEQALRRGIQVWVHAIGDRANRDVLNLFERTLAAIPPEERKVREPRWRIEHAQIVAPADIPRFAKLGVIPSMQPSHAIGDLHFAPSRLGLERLAGAYAWQSFLKSGSFIAGGTDAPVERGEPMIEFYAAVARRDLHGYSGEGWHPEQAVSRSDALKLFTIWAAQAAFEEDSRGSLEPGKLADFTVLSADIMTIPAAEIPKTKCLMTVIAGETVYEAKEEAQK